MRFMRYQMKIFTTTKKLSEPGSRTQLRFLHFQNELQMKCWINKMKQSGFTLIELMMVLAIAAILFTVAVPSFVAMSKNNRLSSHVNTFVTSLHLARSEAYKRKTRVILCSTANPTNAEPTCGGTARDWSTGWLVYALGDTTGRVQPYLYDKTKDTLIRVSEPQRGVNIKANLVLSNDKLEYKYDGSTAESGTAAFAFCDDRGESYGKQLDILPTGRAQLSTTTDCTP